MSGLAIGVTPVAFGFTGGFILKHTRDPRLISRRLAHIGLRTRRCITFSGFGLCSLGFFGFYPQAFSAPFVAGCGGRLALCLAGETGRFRSFPCDTIGFEKGGFGVGGRAPTLGKIIVSVVFQIWLPVITGTQPNDTIYLALSSAFRDRCGGGRPLASQSRLSQPHGLFGPSLVFRARPRRRLFARVKLGLCLAKGDLRPLA